METSLKALIVAVAAFGLAACAVPDRPPSGQPDRPDQGIAGSQMADEAGVEAPSPRSVVVAERQMVASANPVASSVGRDILRRGGSAVDAAIAMQIMLTLVEPQSSGIGGGGFLLHFDARTGAITTYDGRETAPGSTTETLFLDPDGSPMAREKRRIGGRAVAVPGTLRQLAAVHRDHGRLPWAALFEPTIRLAAQGFTVSERLHESVARDGFLADDPTARDYFFDKAGAPLSAGTRLANPALADTLREIAENGLEAFYEGALAADIVAAVREDDNPGQMTKEDISGYETRQRPQLCGPYRVWLVCGFGPPTSGGIATLMILGMLERFDLPAMQPNSADAVHIVGEAIRLAEADRLRYVADPDHVSVPEAGLLDPGYLGERADLIRMDRTIPRVRPGQLRMAARPPEAGSRPSPFPSTTHMSVVDADGNAVALTSSVGGAFGARIMVGGFMLNNHMADFSPTPRDQGGRPRVNRPEAGKRPRSSQSPTLVFDGSGRLKLVLGSPGGRRIIPYVVKTIVGILDWKLDAQAAIELPNIAVRGDRLEIERGTVLEALVPDLRQRGHDPLIVPMTSGIQVIHLRNGQLEGGADPRREGIALGD